MRRYFLFFFLFMSLIMNNIHSEEKVSRRSERSQKVYVAKNYSYLLGMAGFSDHLLKMHFTLYEGYVKNANFLLETLRNLIENNQGSSYEFGALKRRLGWEFDGMRLHEFYFDNLGGSKLIDVTSTLYMQIVKEFGSFETWKKEFIATGMMRGIGWSVLYKDSKGSRLINTWINEHDVGHLAGGEPILVMDVFEHAYMPDYGLDRAKYIEAFFQNINWEICEKRYQLSKGVAK